MPNEYATSLKLDHLPNIRKFTRINRITPEMMDNEPRLEGDLLLGNEEGCIAISMGEDGDYFPRIALSRSIYGIIKEPWQIMCLLTSEHNPRLKSFLYTEICYQAEGVDIRKMELPDIVADMIGVSR